MNNVDWCNDYRRDSLLAFVPPEEFEQRHYIATRLTEGDAANTKTARKPGRFKATLTDHQGNPRVPKVLAVLA